MKQTAKKVRVAPLKPLTKAQQELVTNHIPFAMNMGKKFAGLGRFKGVPMEDLQQEACYGLCIAAQRFKASPQPSPEGEGDMNASFETYAYNWCKKFIMEAINGQPLSSFEEKDMEDVDVLDDEDGNAAEEERALKVQTMLGVLNDKERKVVCLIYGLSYCKEVKDSEPKDFKEVALLLHLHSARVHQIYEQAMAKMEFGLSPALPCREGDVNPLNF